MTTNEMKSFNFPHEKNPQIADLESAYQAFLETVRALSSEAFLASLGDWTTRDILAHFIGWNRITQSGCHEVQQGRGIQ